jgi:hypothetical protein
MERHVEPSLGDSHPPAAGSSRFWLIFLTITWGILGATCGVYVAVATKLVAALPTVICGGAALGVIGGWLVTPHLRRLTELLADVVGNDGSIGPPPRGVLRWGAVVGAAEGILVGILQCQFVVVGIGFCAGVLFGQRCALLAWRVQRKTSLFILGLLIGALIEAAGSLLLGACVVRLAADPVLLLCYGLSGVLAGVLYLWRCLRSSAHSILRR